MHHHHTIHIYFLFSSQVAVSSLDGSHYGAKIEVPSVLPGFIAGLLPWLSAVQYKELCLDIRRAFSFIVLGRDKGETGHVTLDTNDLRPRIHYPLENHDRNSLIDGLCVAARIAAAAGATSIGSSFASMGLVELPPVAEEGDSVASLVRETAVDKFCLRLREHGVTTDYRTLLFSAHQMGTCRMGMDRTSSVVDQHGETWGCRSLYVCDASVFPTSSGVNPMLTTLAIADGIAEVVVQRVLQMKKGSSKL